MLALAGIFCPGIVGAADSLTIAVAANFIMPCKEIAASFEAETKIRVEPTFASTGSLYAQIINGAPYDVFLSADEEKPSALFEKGLGDQPFVYATGKVVLWGTGKDFCGAKNWQDALTKKAIRKIALANPATAPYGAAAEAALKQSGLRQQLGEKLVIAQNVGQSFQYASTGGTEACFCALSSALSSEGKQGCYYAVEQAPPIRQAACRIKASTKQKEILLFLRFLVSPKAETIKKSYGYH
jgi:molybdate transport system substrate-binding protein